MARKKVEPIVSLGDEDKLTVQKSLPLFSLWRSNLTLAEFKILDTYLARIDSHKPERRTVFFEKGELEKLLGVDRIRTEELDERLKHLGTPIKVEDATAKNKRFARISLFEKSVAEQDENGIWQVEMTASQSAMKYFFDIESLGYLRYKLRCIMTLKSRQAYVLFAYLEKNRYRKSWEISLQELKEMLSCENEETYKEFKRFNDRVLKRIQKELLEKTECRFTYETVKKGRSVVAIRFTVDCDSIAKKLEQFEEDPNQITMQAWLDREAQEKEQLNAMTPDEKEKWLADMHRNMWKDVLKDKDGKDIFTSEQLDALGELLYSVPESMLPDVFGEDISEKRHRYMSEKYRLMLAYDSQKPIKNKFSYLCQMLKQDSRA